MGPPKDTSLSPTMGLLLSGLALYAVGMLWALYWHTYGVMPLTRAPLCQAGQGWPEQDCVRRLPATVTGKWDTSDSGGDSPYYYLTVRLPDGSQQDIQVTRHFYDPQQPDDTITVDLWRDDTVYARDGSGPQVKTAAHPAHDGWFMFALMWSVQGAAMVLGIALAKTRWPPRKIDRVQRRRQQATAAVSLTGWAVLGVIPLAVAYVLLYHRYVGNDIWFWLIVFACTALGFHLVREQT